MKEIELFHLDSCPYCINARRAIEELTEENPAFAGISVRWIEESEEPELADSRDYQYVPCIFYGEKKLYEAHFTQLCGDQGQHPRRLRDGPRRLIAPTERRRRKR